MTKSFSEASVLVVGGAGFVGSNLVRRLVTENAAKVIVVDNFLSSEPENLPADPCVSVREGSICDDQMLRDIHDDYDYMFHLATYHGNQSSIHDPLADHQNNLLPSLKLFHHLVGFRRLKKVVYAGAGCAVAEKTFGPTQATRESDPIGFEMDSPYSISKLVGEFYAVYFNRQNGLPTVRARFQNVYGPGEVLGAGQWRGTPATVWRNVTPTFIYKALHKEALPLENGGIATRDFIYVDDIVSGLLLCAEKGIPGEAYNLASGHETSIRELAEIINSLAGNNTPMSILPARTWDSSGRRFGCTRKSKETIGFEVNVQLEEGLKRTIAWTRKHLSFIQRTMDKHLSKIEMRS
ncbi:MAG: nucleotide sugar epimerase [Deltaproteobacteria bacterium]|jgi:nucleoside-diphosphate-sugar epimerase|nr:nucleotide sugar epimerase [Deltaproteobacteria bacterium]